MNNAKIIGISIGRLLISLYFIWSSVAHFFKLNELIELFEVHQYPSPQIFALGYLVLTVLGGLMIFFGFKARFGALILIIVSGAALLTLHSFWDTHPGEDFEQQKLYFLQQLGLIGGLFYVLCCGSGAFSVDMKADKVKGKSKKS
ncbi:MAG: DoxX family protein [Chlamydiota bacterium]